MSSRLFCFGEVRREKHAGARENFIQHKGFDLTAGIGVVSTQLLKICLNQRAS